jgi:hypothetical protein
MAPDVVGPYPPEEVEERCLKCLEVRTVRNHISLKGGSRFKGVFDSKELRKAHEEDIRVIEVYANRHNQRGFHRSGQYQHLESVPIG